MAAALRAVERALAQRPARGRGRGWVLGGLTLLLAWAPWPLGSNRTWAIAVLALAVGLLLMAAWLPLPDARHSHRSPLRRLARARLPAIALLLFAGLVAAQLAGGVRGIAFSTVDPFQTRSYLITCLVYTGLFAAIVLTVRRAAQARAVLLVIVAAGLVQALFAIVLLAQAADHRAMSADGWYPTQATGSFVNRNHLAAYLCLCLSAGIGLLLGSLSAPRAAPPAGQRLRRGLALLLDPRTALRIALVVMVIALVLTRSRMGNAAFFLGLALTAGVLAAAWPVWRRRALWLVLSLVLVDLAVIGQWVGIDRVLQRLEGTALANADRREEETLEARLQPALHTLPMLREKPWTGHGGGTYYTAFPPYKSARMLLHPWHFDHAHNDYAEIAADTGLVGLALLAVVVAASLHRACRLLRAPPSGAGHAVACAGLMASSCLLLHAWVDFNLHIPANAFTYVAMLALLWSVPAPRRTRRITR